MKFIRLLAFRKITLIPSISQFVICRRNLLFFGINYVAFQRVKYLLTEEYLNLRETYINKIQQDATVCRYLFTAKLLYMFRVSIAPIIRIT